MPSNDCLLVVCNAPDEETAERVATTLVAEQLAACVNILGPCRSVYRWQGAVERAEEIPLLIKTRVDAYPQLEARLAALHPYEVPEIVALPVAQGLPSYLTWVSNSVVSSAE
ncbi:divalent-cation tolerance protein CutA [Chromobacterium vaccinii]|nr:divalent-cation tolerance protein CutA [Chromobacterium vaccinii]MBX9349010.1 divalent-cation tolerance protein CutA [Chromobacterium vaccinii]MBX9358029.1 divalent-cation tolerance protein CutA [Chromobacterium vaccinii]MCD4504658.1 divalent-cation tolerance protein CutA [Chromobacterium piscinae]NHQ82264.1 divalent-cation tolerance protein CutA [Chromobacterium vaccinii]